jgi:uncharacterized membrane-anchored protein
MTLVQTLAHAFAPWQSLYSDSKLIAAAVNALHLTGLLFGGGLAVAADRTTLRALKGRPSDRTRALVELGAVHRPVLLALAVVVASGLALAAADVDTFSKSPVFLLKLGIVALLLVNGTVLALTERALRRRPADQPRDPRLWRRLRVATYLSLALWTTTVVVGTVLANAA